MKLVNTLSFDDTWNQHIIFMSDLLDLAPSKLADCTLTKQVCAHPREVFWISTTCHLIQLNLNRFFDWDFTSFWILDNVCKLRHRSKNAFCAKLADVDEVGWATTNVVLVPDIDTKNAVTLHANTERLVLEEVEDAETVRAFLATVTVDRSTKKLWHTALKRVQDTA